MFAHSLPVLCDTALHADSCLTTTIDDANVRGPWPCGLVFNRDFLYGVTCFGVVGRGRPGYLVERSTEHSPVIRVVCSRADPFGQDDEERVELKAMQREKHEEGVGVVHIARRDRPLLPRASGATRESRSEMDERA